MSEPILTVANMNKKFGSTVALNDVSLTVYPGEIRGLIGENGSGKSTVTSIVAGMQECDSGAMTFQGQSWKPLSMIDALHKGIGMIVQESGTIPGITVAENIFLAESEKYKNKFGLINRKKMNADATRVMKNIGVNDVTGEMLMQKLDFQTRKLVEIAKVVMKEPQILVIDETSTALSHDGRELQGDYYRSDFQASSQPEVALDVRNLVYADRLKGISFQVHKGEIVGIGGLAHCGMHSLGKVCFGALKPEEGSVTVEDGTIIDSPAIAMKKRVGYVSKDRDVESLCLNASIEDNISIAGMSEFAINNFLILKNREKKYVNHQIEELSIKCAGRDQSVSQLSGGNKQKVVFGKWIGCGSEILILDCPTRGVDIGVKQAMYQLMVRLKNEGKSILMISEELPELIGMSDRILIMKNGEVSAEFERSETLSDAQIIEYMI